MKIADVLVPPGCVGTKRFVDITLDQALALLNAVEPSLELDEGTEFEWAAMKGLLRYYSEGTGGRVWCWLKRAVASTRRRLEIALGCQF
jgi:hypothetical protein